MAKKQQKNSDSEGQRRQSRKEELIERKHEKQLRVVRIVVAAVLGMILLVLGVGLFNELFRVPNQSVAIVGDKEIALKDWQDRVQYERAQRVIFLENQFESFGGDVGIVQQFGGQVINELFEGEGLGEAALNSMVDEQVICDALAERGIEITDADVQAEIAAGFNYFDGDSPTPAPVATETVVPTPSLTPIPTAIITDVIPTQVPLPTATAGPPATPFPTATPVSLESFEEDFGTLIAQFEDLGISEATYRSVVRAQMCREQLADELAAEQSLSRLAPHASLFLLSFETEEEANDALTAVGDEGYLEVWNALRSEALAGETDEESTGRAFEILSRTRTNLESAQGPAVAEAAFNLGLNEVSGIIPVTNADGSVVYYITMVSGREEREMSQAEYDQLRGQLVQDYVDGQLIGNLQINEVWRGRVPTLPILDSKFLAASTAQPTVPATVEAGGILETPEAGDE